MTKEQKDASLYLWRIKKLRQRISRLEEEIESLLCMAAGVGAIRYDKDRVDTSPANMFEQAMAECDEAQRKLEACKKRYIELVKEIDPVMLKLKRKHRLFIREYFIKDTTLSEAAAATGSKSIYYIKDSSLQEFGEKMKKD